MFKKRGFVDADWALSLAIFLLYLAWFFFFITPFFESQRDIHPLFSIVQDGVNGLTWDIYSIPLFVDSAIKAADEPLVLDYALNFTQDEITFNPHHDFELINDKIIFITNVSRGTNRFYIYYSNRTYSNYIVDTDIISGENFSSNLNNTFEVEYDDMLIDRIYYLDDFIVDSFSISIEGETLSANKTSYSGGEIYSYHSHFNHYFNLSCYVVAFNSRVQCFVKPFDDVTGYNLTLTATLPITFTDYYLNTIFNGDIRRNHTECLDFNWNYIDFRRSGKGVSFIYSNLSRIDMCYTNMSINVNYTLPLRNFNFYIIAHTGNYRNTINYTTSFSHRYGLKEKKTGISLSDFQNLNTSNYNDKKTQWNYPAEREFNILLQNASDHSNIVAYKNNEPPITDDIYVYDVYCLILDKYGNKDKCRLIIQTW